LKRKYNKKAYGLFKDINGLIRDKFAPNPFKPTGRVGSFFGNKIIKTPVHKISYEITGMHYNKNKHRPYRGSIIYTLVKWMVLGFLCLFVIGLIAILG
jgi:hypothetical protein